MIISIFVIKKTIPWDFAEFKTLFFVIVELTKDFGEFDDILAGQVVQICYDATFKSAKVFNAAGGAATGNDIILVYKICV